MPNKNDWQPQKRERCEAPPSSHPLTTHFFVVLVMVALHQTAVSSGPRTSPNLARRVCRGFSTPATYSDGLAGTCRQGSTRPALNEHPPLLLVQVTGGTGSTAVSSALGRVATAQVRTYVSKFYIQRIHSAQSGSLVIHTPATASCPPFSPRPPPCWSCGTGGGSWQRGPEPAHTHGSAGQQQRQQRPASPPPARADTRQHPLQAEGSEQASTSTDVIHDRA